MAEIHDQLDAEGVVREAFASMVKGKRAVAGRLYLTSDRLVFLKSNPLFGAFGALGAALGAAAKPKKLELEIPRGSITAVQRGKFGINKNILEVSHGGGEPARFAVKDYEGWERALQASGAPAPAASPEAP